MHGLIRSWLVIKNPYVNYLLSIVKSNDHWACFLRITKPVKGLELIVQLQELLNVKAVNSFQAIVHEGLVSLKQMYAWFESSEDFFHQCSGILSACSIPKK